MYGLLKLWKDMTVPLVHCIDHALQQEKNLQTTYNFWNQQIPSLQCNWIVMDWQLERGQEEPKSNPFLWLGIPTLRVSWNNLMSLTLRTFRVAALTTLWTKWTCHRSSLREPYTAIVINRFPESVQRFGWHPSDWISKTNLRLSLVFFVFWREQVDCIAD